MSDITVSNDVDNLLKSNNKEAMRESAGLGASDTVEFGGLVQPAGTTAEIDAMTTAEIGAVIWDTDKNQYVRFDTSSTYTTLVGGAKLYLNDPDIGSTDWVTIPQSWKKPIASNQLLATATPITLKQKGWHRVTIKGVLTGLSAPTTSGNITVSVTGSSKIKAWNTQVSQYDPTPSVSSLLSSSTPDANSYTFAFNQAYFSMLSTASKVSYELSVDIYNDNNTEDTVTYTYDSPVLYTAISDVTSVESKLIS